MKFVLTFALGMTIFSKIAQAEIMASPHAPAPAAKNLVVTVTETKGDKKRGDNHQEHDKLRVKIQENKDGHTGHVSTDGKKDPTKKQKWEQEKKAHTVNGVVDPAWEAQMKEEHHKRLAEHHKSKEDHYKHVGEWEAHNKKWEQEKKAHTVNGVVDPAWEAQKKAEHEKIKADHQKHIADYQAKKKEDKQKWDQEKKAHTVNGVLDPVWEAQMKVQHHQKLKEQHQKKFDQEKAKHTVNGVVDPIWEAKAKEQHHKRLGEHHRGSAEHHKNNADYEAKKKADKQKWEQEKKAHTVNGIVDPKWEAQMKEEHHKKSAEHHKKNADWEAEKQKWEAGKTHTDGHKDGGVKAEAQKNEHKDGEHKDGEHKADVKTNEVHKQVVVVKRDVAIGTTKP